MSNKRLQTLQKPAAWSLVPRVGQSNTNPVPAYKRERSERSEQREHRCQQYSMGSLAVCESSLSRTQGSVHTSVGKA